jgi:cytochrome c oxidase subunit IV
LQRLLRWSLAWTVPLCAALPAVARVHAAVDRLPLTWALMLLVSLLRAVVGLNVFTRYAHPTVHGV